jgi:PHD/YefM family antitoxin component YafN of YafNO toxin-antitoxin module
MNANRLFESREALEVSTEELRLNLANYLSQVRYADQVVVVKKYNQDAAIILSPRMLKRILDATTTTREERKQAIRELKLSLEKIPVNDPATTREDIHRAIAEVRAAKRKKKSR